MKEYCLVPVKIAEKYIQSKNKIPTQESTPKAVIPATKPRPIVSPPSTPNVNSLVKSFMTPATQEFGVSVVNLLRNSPGVSWDDKGNLLAPISGINLIDLLQIMANKKGTFPAAHRPLIKTLFGLTDLPKDIIKNPSERKRVFGGGAGQFIGWEAY